MAAAVLNTNSPFSIYEDDPSNNDELPSDDLPVAASSSPNNCDVPLSSIEHGDPPSPPLSPDAVENRRVSAMTSTSISSFPSSLSYDLKDPYQDYPQHAPMKARTPFRNTSSVRALQMASPPPFSTPRSQRAPAHKSSLSAHSQRSGTPRSARSGSVRSVHQHHCANSQHSSQELGSTPGTPTAPPKREHYPLVLLHVTLLPPSLPYPAPLLEAVLPPVVVRNFRLLEAKLSDPVLMNRGILIPHPREEYDLLEERLLESLELRVPRVLKCGHFVGGRSRQSLGSISLGSVSSSRPSSRVDGSLHDVEHELNDDAGTETGSEVTALVDGEDSDEDGPLCIDCHHPIAHPDAKRWDVKIYAANGLMRAGAWAAAWSEMERVDVEVMPYISEELRRSLDRRAQEEEEEQAARIRDGEEQQRRVEEARAELEAREREREMAAEKERLAAAAAASDGFPAPESHRSPAITPITEHTHLPTPSPSHVASSPPSSSRTHPRSHPRADQVPLPELLRNYILVLAADRRNLAVGLLSLLVLLLALRPGTRNALPAPYFPPAPEQTVSAVVALTPGKVPAPAAEQVPPVSALEAEVQDGSTFAERAADEAAVVTVTQTVTRAAGAEAGTETEAGTSGTAGQEEAVSSSLGSLSNSASGSASTSASASAAPQSPLLPLAPLVEVEEQISRTEGEETEAEAAAVAAQKSEEEVNVPEPRTVASPAAEVPSEEPAPPSPQAESAGSGAETGAEAGSERVAPGAGAA